ncbi:MAG: hypothetical protein HZA49_06980 [Planctomycetes bacterium]|nr:hypothetical protein [Planctomycetota bacterium]
MVVILLGRKAEQVAVLVCGKVAVPAVGDLAEVVDRVGVDPAVLAGVLVLVEAEVAVRGVAVVVLAGNRF